MVADSSGFPKNLENLNLPTDKVRRRCHVMIGWLSPVYYLSLPPHSVGPLVRFLLQFYTYRSGFLQTHTPDNP